MCVSLTTRGRGKNLAPQMKCVQDMARTLGWARLGMGEGDCGNDHYLVPQLYIHVPKLEIILCTHNSFGGGGGGGGVGGCGGVLRIGDVLLLGVLNMVCYCQEY